MALTTEREELEQIVLTAARGPVRDEVAELSRRLDALAHAVEILARERYDFPGLPESSVRNALMRARRA